MLPLVRLAGQSILNPLRIDWPASLTFSVTPSTHTCTLMQCLVVAAGNRRNGQAHYLSLVDGTEGARADARKQCLVLMQRRIQEQLTTLRRRSGELRRRLAKREHRERVRESLV